MGISHSEVAVIDSHRPIPALLNRELRSGFKIAPTMSTSDNVISAVAGNPSTSGGLHIPESKDGFFGYSEEKSLQQVTEQPFKCIYVPDSSVAH